MFHSQPHNIYHACNLGGCCCCRYASRCAACEAEAEGGAASLLCVGVRSVAAPALLPLAWRAEGVGVTLSDV